MSYIVDAKGLACPQPVILTKKALETNSEVTVLVDNATALENVKRMAASQGCSAEVAEKSGIYEISLMKKGTEPQDKPGTETGNAISGSHVVVVSTDKMGSGSDELGAILMKAFIHTLLDLDTKPDMMIFYNAGVKLAVEGSAVLDDLKTLEKRGAEILVCGTCVNFFEIADKVGVGIVSNMYDIAGTMSRAGRIVRP